MNYKSLYEKLGVITKQLPSKLYETDKGMRIDGNHSVGDVLVREKEGKKKVSVFKGEDWRAMPKNKTEAQKAQKDADALDAENTLDEEDNHDA